MYRCIVAVLAGCVLFVASCSSSSSTSLLPADSGSRQVFSVQAEPGSEFDTRLDVSVNGSKTEVAIWAEDVVDLSNACLSLRYDVAKYTPRLVEIGEFLGTPDEVLNLSLTDIAGEVPIGIAQIEAVGRPANGTGLLATVTFENTPFTGERKVSRAPDGSDNQVIDLIATTNSPTNATLQWTERNIGDYDNNTEVGAADIVPLARFIFQRVEQASNPVWAGLMDGDSNGEINSGDIVPIAVHYGTTLKGYQVYFGTEGATPVGDTECYSERPLKVDRTVPYRYNVDVDFTEGSNPVFTIRPVANDGQDTTGVLSNSAEVLVITDPPVAPSNLMALAGSTHGAGVIHLEWSASTSEHLTKYEIQRKLTSEDDSAWAMVMEVGASSLIYNDSELADNSYDYRVYAWNAGNLRSEQPSNTATNSPWFVPPPSPPTGVTAVPGDFDNSIRVSWTAPGDGSAERFSVYRKAPNDTEFSKIHTTTNASETSRTDQGLTAGQTYQYYVTSVQGFGATAVESDPSTSASAMPKEPSNVTIESLVTDKTTHYKGGGEPASNITVTCSAAPPSITWGASLGSVTGTGTTVTWAPPAGATAQNVTITCTVPGDEESITLHVVDNEIINTTNTPPGYYVEFTAPLVEALSEGGNIINDRPFSWFVDGQHVILFDRWETWCTPCTGEMKDLNDLAVLHKSKGLYVLQMNRDDDVNTTKNYYVSKNYTDIWGYNSATLTNGIWSKLGIGTGIPYKVVIDKDGWLRFQGTGTGKLGQAETIALQCLGYF